MLERFLERGPYFLRKLPFLKKEDFYIEPEIDSNGFAVELEKHAFVRGVIKQGVGGDRKVLYVRMSMSDWPGVFSIADGISIDGVGLDYGVSFLRKNMRRSQIKENTYLQWLERAKKEMVSVLGVRVGYRLGKESILFKTGLWQEKARGDSVYRRKT